MSLILRNDTAATPPGVAVTTDVLANDTLDGAPLTPGDLDAPLSATLIGPAGAGTVSATDGSVAFTPAPGFSGQVAVQYDASAASCPCELGTVEWGCCNYYLTLADFCLDTEPDWWGEMLILSVDGGGGVPLSFSEEGYRVNGFSNAEWNNVVIYHESIGPLLCINQINWSSA